MKTATKADLRNAALTTLRELGGFRSAGEVHKRLVARGTDCSRAAVQKHLEAMADASEILREWMTFERNGAPRRGRGYSVPSAPDELDFAEDPFADIVETEPGGIESQIQQIVNEVWGRICPWALKPAVVTEGSKVLVIHGDAWSEHTDTKSARRDIANLAGIIAVESKGR